MSEEETNSRSPGLQPVSEATNIEATDETNTNTKVEDSSTTTKNEPEVTTFASTKSSDSESLTSASKTADKQNCIMFYGVTYLGINSYLLTIFVFYDKRQNI